MVAAKYCKVLSERGKLGDNVCVFVKGLNFWKC